ncbi:MAG: hypothetical protein ACYC9M_06410 [Desulfobulbaceae bacterium]
MFKKTAFVLVVALLVPPLSPSIGMTWYPHSPGPYYHGGYYGHYDHYDHDDDALLWFGGILLGTLFLSSMLQQPAYEPPVYYQPQPQVYTYPPYVPPGMCRWERYMRDRQGRFVLDQYGQPIKEYTLGSCQYPPPN